MICQQLLNSVCKIRYKTFFFSPHLMLSIFWFFTCSVINTANSWYQEVWLPLKSHLKNQQYQTWLLCSQKYFKAFGKDLSTFFLNIKYNFLMLKLRKNGHWSTQLFSMKFSLHKECDCVWIYPSITLNRSVRKVYWRYQVWALDHWHPKK